MNLDDRITLSVSFLNYIYDETKIILNKRCELQIKKEKSLKINKKKKLNAQNNGFKHSENNRNMSLQIVRIKAEGFPFAPWGYLV
ncbi:hypothetical protein RhiirA4_463776 [Rhizophagus irregularis]|uniref:Uncharacterized protein n=1 Tax=Rhizophagus irregularis TaxID=588596 RepID=A0A2I1GNL4_9GLOM|nr:hypothetical protein RhiirA4_463776 [Rhizophagus irregularis]